MYVAHATDAAALALANVYYVIGWPDEGDSSQSKRVTWLVNLMKHRMTAAMCHLSKSDGLHAPFLVAVATDVERMLRALIYGLVIYRDPKRCSPPKPKKTENR